MSDDRLRRGFRALGEGIRSDPDEALGAVLPRARRRRAARRLAAGAIGTLTITGLVFASPAVLHSLRLPVTQSPMPGPGTGGLAPSPGTEPPYEQCVDFNVGRPSEIDDARSLCGVVPPARAVDGGVGYRMRTTTGETFWAVFSDGLRGSAESAPIVVPGVLVDLDDDGEGWHGAPLIDLTTADPAEAVEHACRDGDARPAACEQASDPIVLPSGAVMQRWSRVTFVTTVDLGRWTVVICCAGPPERQERVARALTWADHGDLFLTLGSSDPGVRVSADWASVLPWFHTSTGGHTMRILPGCALGGRDPDLGGRAVFDSDIEFTPGKDDSPKGNARWCSNGYLVDVDQVDFKEAEEFHHGLRVVKDLVFGVPLVGPTATP